MRPLVSVAIKEALKKARDACATYSRPQHRRCSAGCRIRTIAEKASRYAAPLAPYPLGGLNDDAELTLLVLGAQGVAEDGGREPALRRA